MVQQEKGRSCPRSTRPGSTSAWLRLLLVGCGLLLSCHHLFSYDVPADRSRDGLHPSEAGGDAGAGDSEAGPADLGPLIAFKALPLPAGGKVEELVISPERSILHAIVSESRLFRSMDSGNSWTECVLPAEGPGCLAASRTQEGGVFLCAGQDLYFSPAGCSSWQALELVARPLTVFAANEDELLAATAQGIWKRTSAGWQQLYSIEGVTALIGSDDLRQLFAASSSTGLYSADGGLSWSSSITYPQDNPVHKLRLHGNRLFAGTWNGLIYSDDYGASWNPPIEGTEPIGVYDVLVHPSDSTRMIASTAVSGLLLLTVTGGGSYIVPFPSGELGQSRVDVILSDPQEDGMRIIAGSWSGVYTTTWDNVEGWTSSSTGLAAPHLTDILALPSGTLVLATHGGLLFSTDSGQSWEAASVNYGCYNIINDLELSPDGAVWAAGKTLLRSEGGTSFLNLMKDCQDWAFISMAAEQDHIYAGTNKHFFSFSSSADTLPSDAYRFVDGERYIEDLLILQPGTLLAAAWQEPAGPGGIYLSEDQGQTFTRLVREPPDTSPVHALARLDTNTVAAGSDDGVYLADPQTWEWTRTDGPSFPTHALLVVNGMLIAGGRGGVAYTRNRSQSWTDLPGLEHAQVTALASEPGGRLLVTTLAHGLFSTTLP